ncbi:unnamed protein product [Strongylus vulgaris]|uniref:Uncharacterized protein n=1 Tax=Strongylus vulgaris TaxID=40348 RepID=A0A3P7ILM8_STRVU|nr:unnamed protein product [Strongylus vulgaris]
MAGICVPPSPEELASADYSTKPRNWPKEEEHVQVCAVKAQVEMCFFSVIPL